MKLTTWLRVLGLEVFFPLVPSGYQWSVSMNSLKYDMKKRLVSEVLCHCCVQKVTHHLLLVWEKCLFNERKVFLAKLFLSLQHLSIDPWFVLQKRKKMMKK